MLASHSAQPTMAEGVGALWKALGPKEDDVRQGLASAPGPEQVANDGPLLRLEGVGVTYLGPVPVPALREVDLVVGRGEYLAIVGPSGSGKSTLLNILGLLDRPTAGRYAFGGEDTALMPESARTRLRSTQIGFVFQSFHLMPHRTASQNVAMPLIYRGVGRRDRRRIAREQLAMVGLADRAEALPMTMSGGERQRVAIARALASGPSLLLCDEPTGNLDSTTAAGILATIDSLNRSGLTVLMITHDMDVAAHADRTVVIRDGRLSTPV